MNKTSFIIGCIAFICSAALMSPESQTVRAQEQGEQQKVAQAIATEAQSKPVEAKTDTPKPEAAKPEAAKPEAAKPVESKPADPKPSEPMNSPAATTTRAETPPAATVNNENPVGPATPAPVTAEQLLVFPNQVELSTSRDSQSLVAQILYSNGVTEDVSDRIEIKIANSEMLTLNGRVITPVSDGETVLQVSADGFSIDVPVKVGDAAASPAISFKNDVMPVFSKSGCNAGSCHGAARGKDGFRLSLYGFDPAGDYHRLTREMLGRRIDLAVPDDCLLMNKATGSVPHSGGSLFKPESPYYATLMTWLENGAAFDSGPVPTVTGIELFPKSALLDGEGSRQQMTVRATYSDGTDRDVTSLAYFSTNNDNSAIVDQDGMVSAKNRGEAFVMCRFDTHTVGADFIVLPKGLDFNWSEIEETNYVDSRINEKLKKLRIQPSSLCTDAEFIRRASIDICGVVPDAEAIQKFLDDPHPAKRSRIIDELLERKEFVELWVMKWSELLQVRSTQQVSYKSTLLYYDWLKARIANDVPVNEMVKELLSAQGGTFSVPATNFYQNERDNLKIAENVAQVFLGMRIQCTQCHNHPFDRWTMEDYYGFAAFFAQVARKRGEDPRETIVFNRGAGETKHPVTKKNMKPKFLGGIEPDVKGKDRRAVLGEWIASSENPYFAKNLANIVWAHFFGRGIVDEVDDVRVSNPAVNPQLLEELGAKLKEYNYDFKKLVRDICNSRTYQASTQTNPTNESDQANFSHAKLRRIRSEVLLDVISQITETKNKFPGLPLGARAVQIADGNTSNYFLTTFGRAKRETVCSCEVKMDPNLSQALHLLNGETVHNKIIQGKLIQRLLAEKKTHDEILDTIYFRCLTRRPSEIERQKLHAEIALNDNKQQALEDVFWAILNSREFVFNH